MHKSFLHSMYIKYLELNQRETNKLNVYGFKWLLFCPYKLEFRIRNESKFFSYSFSVTVETKLETGLSIIQTDRKKNEPYYKEKKIQNKDRGSHFLVICSAARLGGGGVILLSKCPLI